MLPRAIAILLGALFLWTASSLLLDPDIAVGTLARHITRSSAQVLVATAFFRQMPNALLGRYFAARTVFGEFDFAAMSETRHDELFAAWLALPETARNAMDADFRAIFELSCEKGCRAILDEAQLHLAPGTWHLAPGTWRKTHDVDPNAANAFTEMLAALVNLSSYIFYAI